MNIKQAKLCLDCDEVFAGIRESGNQVSQNCSACGSTAWIWLTNILVNSRDKVIDLRVGAALTH